MRKPGPIVFVSVNKCKKPRHSSGSVFFNLLLILLVNSQLFQDRFFRRTGIVEADLHATPSSM